MPEMPDLPKLGSDERPPSMADLRFARAFLLGGTLLFAGMLAWHWVGGGAVWLGILFGLGLAVCALGALSTHGQLHGWDALTDDDAPEASPREAEPSHGDRS